jgi:predicted permease
VSKGLFIAILFLFLGNSIVFAQAKNATPITKKYSLKSNNIDPLTPAKAAFYSAVLPGLGQAYNKKYWKIPLVYGAIGTSLYFYINSNSKYQDYRGAYKRRLEGFNDDKFSYLDTNRFLCFKHYRRQCRCGFNTI